MQVNFLRNSFEDVNLSMKVYADELICGMNCAKVEMDYSEILPRSRFARSLAIVKPIERFCNYYERYSLYPRVAKRLKADVFHIIDHTFSYLLKHIDKNRTVVTCHDLILLKMLKGEFKGKTAPAFAAHLFKRSLDNIHLAEKIISISESTKIDLMKLLSIPSEKITVIPYGVNEIFRSSSGRGDSRKKDSYSLLHVGANLFYKNFDGILKGLASVESSLKKRLKLIKVGGDLTREHLDIISRFNLKDNIIVKRYASRDELAGLYKSSDAFIFPSLYEGFGLPPLEAMASGLPVITSRAASLPEVCGDAALYIDPYDHAQIGSGIERILTDQSLRANLVEKGLKRANMFSWEKAARKTYDVYKEII